MDEQSNIIIYNSDDGRTNVALMTRDGNVWLNQNQMAELFATSKQNIGQLIGKILKENELNVNSTVKYYFTVASNGKQYQMLYYSLEMILAVGYRVRGIRGTQFRQWATQHLSEYLIKGFTIDTERLKNPDGRPDYFDELLSKIRDIRASEKRFYQKVRDLFTLCSDYDKTDKATQMFFAETQNKLLYAVTQRTAAEIIVDRADAAKPNMGLTSWQGSVVRKGDVVIAKNYLNADEIDTLNRLVNIFLEAAELRVKERKDLTISYWRKNVDALLDFQDKPLLKGKGSITAQESEERARRIYDEFQQLRKRQEAVAADMEDLKFLDQIAEDIKDKKDT
ncbi:MAG: virulence RhuM family protein [Bacteroidales bacterium]|nr:virulence RhuM family protein [Bacteroidales bacterium]